MRRTSPRGSTSGEITEQVECQMWGCRFEQRCDKAKQCLPLRIDVHAAGLRTNHETVRTPWGSTVPQSRGGIRGCLPSSAMRLLLRTASPKASPSAPSARGRRRGRPFPVASRGGAHEDTVLATNHVNGGSRSDCSRVTLLSALLVASRSMRFRPAPPTRRPRG